MNSKRMEVLSPAGSFEALETAVRSGADAVYFGAKDFSARRNAANFDFDEIKQAVKYCHIRGVKAYLTLNIMVKDSEIDNAFNLAQFANDVGIDALIISDLGLASLIHKYLPQLPLHASTQMTVHSPSPLKFLKNMGFTRVVAAREMNKNQLVSLCNEAKMLDMSVEVFVHGALCMCVSGQCLLSSVIGARSGNRGLCAGPCRLPFKVSGGTGYDLSLKDLSLYAHIKELEEMGVESLKIEGRMKRPEYIAAATAACKQMRDDDFIDSQLDLSLRNVFSRSGFTDGYFTGSIGKDMFGIRTKDDVMLSKESFAVIRNIYRNERQSIPFTYSIKVLENEPVTLTVSDGNWETTVCGEIPQKAISKSIDEDAVRSSIEKTGGTPYYAVKATAEIGKGLFVSAGALNALRRDALEKLSLLRGQTQERKSLPFCRESQDTVFKKAKHLYVRVDNPEQIPNGINADMLIIPMQFAENVKRADISLCVEIPRFIDDEMKTLEKLKALKEKGYTYALCGTLTDIFLAKSAELKPIGGIGLNVLNEYTVKVFKDAGLKKVTFSAETLIGEPVCKNDFPETGIFAYGRLPLMLFKNCPVKNGKDCNECKRNSYITDRMGVKFPIRCLSGFSELYNSKYLYLADRLEEIRNADYLLLYFTDEDKDRVSEVINEYRTGGLPPKNHTRGLYYRETL